VAQADTTKRHRKAGAGRLPCPVTRPSRLRGDSAGSVTHSAHAAPDERPLSEA
jgi:hypothetical protein